MKLANTKPKSVVLVCVIIGFLVGANLTLANDTPDCGRILKYDAPDTVIYSYCPSLVKMTPMQVREAVNSVFEKMAGLDGEILIYFFSDSSIMETTDWTVHDHKKLIASWGNAFLGSYYTHSGKLTVRVDYQNEWIDIDIPND